ncbi:hypothetical protein Tco_0064757 [Tanacetum coccineum]
MSSPHKSLPKPSRVAKMSVRPTWRKKLNHCNSSNEVDVNLPTPIPKPQSPLNQNQPSHENSPTTKTNHDSLPSHLPPLGDSCNTNAVNYSTPLLVFHKEQVEIEIVALYFVKTAYQLADNFTKALGIPSITPEEFKSLIESEEE